jgi:hypothetical protein
MAISKKKKTHSMVTILVALAFFLFFGIMFSSSHQNQNEKIPQKQKQ